MQLIFEILCAILAVFGAYVLLRRWFAVENEIVLAVLCKENTDDAEFARLVRRARDDAWLCGKRRVIFFKDGQK